MNERDYIPTRLHLQKQVVVGFGPWATVCWPWSRCRAESRAETSSLGPLARPVRVRLFCSASGKDDVRKFLHASTDLAFFPLETSVAFKMIGMIRCHFLLVTSWFLIMKETGLLSSATKVCVCFHRALRCSSP